MKETEKIRIELLENVSRLTDDQLNKRVVEGKWTIMQVLDHLYLMERAIVGSMTAALAKEENNPTELKPYLLTLDRSRKIEAPVPLTPPDSYQTLEQMMLKLESSRKALTNLVTGLSDEFLIRKSFPHPVFGLMDAKQWIHFIGIHEKRHLAQIEELEQSLSYSC